MTLQQFIKHHNEWKKDFYSKYCLLDVDFECYVLMNTDLDKKGFRELMDRWNAISSPGGIVRYKTKNER